MGYHGANSPPIGLHYGGPPPGPAFTREVFTVVDPFGINWIVPAGVTSIDMLLVGGGGASVGPQDSFGLFNCASGGGGGGGVVVANAIAVNPGDLLDIFVGPGDTVGAGGGESLVRNLTLGGIVIAGPAGGGGVCGNPLTTPGLNGFPANGSGAGGTWDISAAADCPPTLGNAAGRPGGNGAGPAAATLNETAAGGGGGADPVDGPGGIGVAVGGGTPGTGGDGGFGVVPADSTFGPWGADIGEAGVFGGGGAGRSGLGGPTWNIGQRGVGGGAPNTGGGGTPDDFPGVGEGAGFDGIVVFIYATP